MKKLTAIIAALLISAMSLFATACTPEQITAYRSAGIVISYDQEQALLALPNRYVHPDPDVERWYDTAIAAGWSADMWQWQSCVIERESNGNPNVWYRFDPAGGSRGLMQINGSNVGFLQGQGILNTANDLFDPLTNLQAALALYNLSGASPWASRHQPC